MASIEGEDSDGFEYLSDSDLDEAECLGSEPASTHRDNDNAAQSSAVSPNDDAINLLPYIANAIEGEESMCRAMCPLLALLVTQQVFAALQDSTRLDSAVTQERCITELFEKDSKFETLLLSARANQDCYHPVAELLSVEHRDISLRSECSGSSNVEELLGVLQKAAGDNGRSAILLSVANSKTGESDLHPTLTLVCFKVQSQGELCFVTVDREPGPEHGCSLRAVARHSANDAAQYIADILQLQGATTFVAHFFQPAAPGHLVDIDVWKLVDNSDQSKDPRQTESSKQTDDLKQTDDSKQKESPTSRVASLALPPLEPKADPAPITSTPLPADRRESTLSIAPPPYTEMAEAPLTMIKDENTEPLVQRAVVVVAEPSTSQRRTSARSPKSIPRKPSGQDISWMLQLQKPTRPSPFQSASPPSTIMHEPIQEKEEAPSVSTNEEPQHVGVQVYSEDKLQLLFGRRPTQFKPKPSSSPISNFEQGRSFKSDDIDSSSKSHIKSPTIQNDLEIVTEDGEGGEPHSAPKVGKEIKKPEEAKIDTSIKDKSDTPSNTMLDKQRSIKDDAEGDSKDDLNEMQSNRSRVDTKGKGKARERRTKHSDFQWQLGLMSMPTTQDQGWTQDEAKQQPLAKESSSPKPPSRSSDAWSPLFLRPELVQQVSASPARSHNPKLPADSVSSDKGKGKQREVESDENLIHNRRTYYAARNDIAWQFALAATTLKPSEDYLKERQERIKQMRIELGQVPFDCLVCFETIEWEDGARMTDCEHGFCKECVTGHVQSKLDENQYPIVCPICLAERDRKKRGYVDGSLVLTLGISDKYQDKFIELQIAQLSIQLECPACKESMKIAREDYLAEPFIHCPLPGCRQRFCRACQLIFEGTNTDHACKIDEALDTLMRDNGWRYCPGCKTPIQKESGCNHMTCGTPGCSVHFCYTCGASIWDSKSVEPLAQCITNHYANCTHFDPPARPPLIDRIGGPVAVRQNIANRRRQGDCVIQ